MGFRDKPTTKKGAIGQELGRRELEKHGYVVYEPQTNAAHPFDILYASSDKRRLGIAEIKTKGLRDYYPDTGINRRHYEDYKAIAAKYGIDVVLVFVDDKVGEIYGNRLSLLEESRLIVHGNKTLSYPLTQGKIIYFPRESMVKISDMSAEDMKRLAEYTRRNPKYDAT